MTAALRSNFTYPSPIEDRGQQANGLLDHLRGVARRVRCKSHTDLFGACAALSGNRQVAAQASCEVLMRCLSQALGHRPIFLRPGERERSFDEAWLLSLARCLGEGDLPSATFLLHSRVPDHARRNVVFLLRGVIERF